MKCTFQQLYTDALYLHAAGAYLTPLSIPKVMWRRSYAKERAWSVGAVTLTGQLNDSGRRLSRYTLCTGCSSRMGLELNRGLCDEKQLTTRRSNGRTHVACFWDSWLLCDDTNPLFISTYKQTNYLLFDLHFNIIP